MTIHSAHPFQNPLRDTVRQLRGRLGGRVCLLTAGDGRSRAGWTVSSILLVDGEAWRTLALVDPDSDLCDRVEATGRAVLQLLGPEDRYLADAFAGLAPAPGGPFTLGEWEQTEAGPHLTTAGNWATLTLEQASDIGWSRQLVLTVDEARSSVDDEALHHVRGRYRTIG